LKVLNLIDFKSGAHIKTLSRCGLERSGTEDLAQMMKMFENSGLPQDVEALKVAKAAGDL